MPLGSPGWAQKVIKFLPLHADDQHLRIVAQPVPHRQSKASVPLKLKERRRPRLQLPMPVRERGGSGYTRVERSGPA